MSVNIDNSNLKKVNKQKFVEEILLTHIECENKNAKICILDNKIMTGQAYHREIDEDMSDFSIGFYEILYSDILKKNKILNEEGHIIKANFAGDTMYSFNTIANMTPGAGKSKNQRTKEEKWPKYLRDYHNIYHCLANFWLIPMHYGRCVMYNSNREFATKENDFDSPELFVEFIKNEWDNEKKNNMYDYFNEFSNVDEFCDVHYFKARSFNEVKEMYKKGNSEEIINYNISSIRKRAKDISQSEKCDKLYDYFLLNNM